MRTSLVARAPRARMSFCSRARARACAHVPKCSRARAAHPAAVEAPHMNSYVLNEAKITLQKHTNTLQKHGIWRILWKNVESGIAVQNVFWTVFLVVVVVAI